MAAGELAEVLAAPFTAWVAPVSTAFPILSTAESGFASSWTKVGTSGTKSYSESGVTVTHTQRWHAHYHSAGSGPLYQGRFKSFPIQRDEHLLTVLRYVERNPLRAGLVTRAEAWNWSGLAKRVGGPLPEWLTPPGPTVVCWKPAPP